MSLLKVERHRNGDGWSPVEIYECDRCEQEVSEMWPHHIDREKDYHLCWDCSFIEGVNTADEYMRYIPVTATHAIVHESGEIEVWTGRNKTPPSKRGDQGQRNSPQYREWRTNVFERDSYTCQQCGQVGGELNAHHIKPFSEYVELRFELSNGLTLCVPCHKEVHRSEGNE